MQKNSICELTIAQFYRAISSQKNLLGSNISPHVLTILANVGPLAAKIVSLVWGTPANFNGFCILAALLHGTLLVGVS